MVDFSSFRSSRQSRPVSEITFGALLLRQGTGSYRSKRSAPALDLSHYKIASRDRERDPSAAAQIRANEELDKTRASGEERFADVVGFKRRENTPGALTVKECVSFSAFVFI